MNSIRDLWPKQKTDKDACVQWWESMAEGFASKEMPTAQNSLALKIADREGMLTGGSRALDVGCGSGSYTISLASRGALASGIDISPKMIDYARKAARGNANIDFSVADWHSLDLKSRGWDSAFDLVLANTTPAVGDSEGFMKLCSASRKWCLVVKPTRRTNKVLDKLYELIGVAGDIKRPDKTLAYAFGSLWEEGYSPKLEYEPQVWNGKVPVEKAIEQYTRRIETFHTINMEQKKNIEDYILKNAKDGYIEETTHTTAVAIYWRVDI